MNIEEIREKILEIVGSGMKQYGNSFSQPDVTYPLWERRRDITDQILSTEIVPERECRECGDNPKYFFGSPRPKCPKCNGTGSFPPVTVEQAIKKVLE